MCAGHSLHRDDWLKLALLAGGAAATGGALGVGPLAGMFGAGSAAAGAASVPLTAAEIGASGDLAAAGLAPELAASAPLTGAEMGNTAVQRGLLSQIKGAAPKLLKAGATAQQLGLLGGGRQQPAMPVVPPGGAPQIAGMPTSAQLAFPDAYQPQQPQIPLSELLRRLQMQGYA